MVPRGIRGSDCLGSREHFARPSYSTVPPAHMSSGIVASNIVYSNVDRCYNLLYHTGSS